MRSAFFALIFGTTLAVAQPNADLHTGSWRGRTVVYRIVNGAPIAEGDIILDNIQELESEGSPGRLRPNATGVSVNSQRWPNRTVPYVVDAGIPNQKRVTDALQHWNDNSVMQMIPRTDEANYVHFVRDNSNGGACSSSIGMIGGEQRIRTDDSCLAGALIHELGHAVGLNHEQSRIDRDKYVSVNWDIIDPLRFHDFNQAINGSADYGLYDFGSIMHYSATTGFENKPMVSALQTIPRGIPVGQSTALSAGDLDAVKRMYGVKPTSTMITTYPARLDVIVDGTRVTTPMSFDWEPGSAHTVDIPDGPQGSGSVRYLFGRWTDDGDKAHTITASPDVTVIEAAFIRQFRIPTNSSPAIGGTVTIDPPSDDGFYTDGTPATVTAEPAPGYFFTTWASVPSGIHGLGDNPAVTRITSTWDYTASFRTSPPNVVIDSVPPHRTISGDGSSHGALWRAIYANDTNHTIATTTTQFGPSGVTRYVFTDWSDSGAASHSVMASSTPATYSANFRTDYLLSIVIDGSGTVERVPASSDGYYQSGAQVQLIPHPAAGSTFVDWTGDLSGTSPAASVTMDGERVVTALFRGVASTPFNGVLNAATLQQTNYISAGELLVINGTQGAPDGLLTAQPGIDGTLPSILGNTRVMIDGKAAPIVSVNGNQITTMVPFSSAGKSAVPVQIVYNSRNSTFVSIEMVTAVPGIFTVDGSGSGAAKVTNQDGSSNTTDTPAARGSVITFQATGFGKMSPVTADNAIVGDNLPVPELPVSVSIGGVDAPVTAATGVKGSLPGLVQVSVQVPDAVPSGAVALALKVGTQVARQHVTIAIQ